MIQKEEVIKRRKEIAEIRHADSVYRDILARENEREDYEKRWFWELLQNAKDSVAENEKVSVKIDISENEISFSHTGNPFELDDILSLIIQGSSKINKEGKTGRFGTGFMTTYLLSKEVKISGKLTEDKGCFEFLLNRNASNNDEFYLKQQESNDNFVNAIRESSYLGTSDFQTKFTYSLDTKGRHTAEIGLLCLDELIPITQLFNQQIESVIVNYANDEKTFSKIFISNHLIDGYAINEWELNTFINGKIDKQSKAYHLHHEDYETCIITQMSNGIEKIFPLTNNYPRLYFTFPLIGTEEIGIPFIINSTKFDPRIERDGVYLKKTNENNDETTNKEIIHKALIESSKAFSNLFLLKSVLGIYELFNYKSSKDLKWVDHEWFKKIKIETIDVLSSIAILRVNNEPDKVISLNAIAIPYATTSKNINSLWILLSQITEKDVPVKEELENWIQIVENIATIKELHSDVYSLKYVFGLKELITFVENKRTQDNIIGVLRGELGSWLDDFYSLIKNQFDSIPLDRRIILNQDDNFRNGEGMFWDKSNDEELIAISKLLGTNFANKFISKRVSYFHIVGIENFSKQDAINEIKSSINDLSENSFTKKELLQSNARFLKWLIDNNQKETIRDLKVLSGASKKNEENFIFDHFPKTEHLLLSPKICFENNYPFYANIIRDRDCLNEIYNEYLDSEHFKYLENNSFIHFMPIVVKQDVVDKRILELLIVKEEDLNYLKDDDGQINQKVSLIYSDFAYLTSTGGHIYDRNSTQKSSLERFKFLLLEAVEKDTLFNDDLQEIKIQGVEKTILFHKCLWVYRAKRLSWVYIKTASDSNEVKFSNETPSSKNLSELIKEDDSLIKAIRGSGQQLFLNKLGVGVSDLIRHTLPTDELRLSWDKAITNMITSDANPELVQEIFNDPNIRKEYEKRLNQRNLINRNQKIGKLIEDLFKEAIIKLKEKGYLVNINREPFGSDFILTDESSDLVNNNNEREGFKLNNWLVELKATGKDYAAMTPLQARTATEKKDNYALIVVPLGGSDPDLNYVRQNAKVIDFIGNKIESVITDFNEIELKKIDLNFGKDGISVNIEEENIRFKISSQIWQNENVTDIENFIVNNFAKHLMLKTDLSL